MGVTNSIEYDANNYMDAAMAPANLAHKQAILKDTWGHLAPSKNRTYRGYIVFSIAGYGGDMVILDADFVGLPGSPWFFDAMHHFVFGEPQWSDLIDGAVYRFEGSFRNYRFRGKRTILYQPARGSARCRPAAKQEGR
jgi:hypothetical protein